MMSRFPEVPLLLFLALLGGAASAHALDQPSRPEVANALRGLDVPFVRNTGQLPPEVAFSARTSSGQFFVTAAGEMVFVSPRRAQAGAVPLIVREALAGGRVREVAGADPCRTRVSSFVGNDPARWQRGVPAYGAVSLGLVYDGIELLLRARGGTVEKVFHVHPGADPAAISVTIAGAGGLTVDGQGRLVVGAGSAEGIVFTRPEAYQMRDGARQPVAVAYALHGDGYSFSVGEYDRERELVIDPLLQSTYLGGTGDTDRIYSVAVHPASGAVYAVGTTDSLDFPATPGGHETVNQGGDDAFVAILDPGLTSLAQVTYYGGSGEEAAGSGDGGNGLAFHPSSGEVYITGYTTSADLPEIFGAAQAAKSGGIDGFIARFSQDLATLHRTTYLGGSSDDIACGIASRPRHYGPYHYLYVVGRTASKNLPGISGWSFQRTHGGGTWDAFVGFVRDDLGSFKTTYLGGAADDWGYAVAVRHDPLDLIYEAYVTGHTQSGDFPATAGSAQPRRRGYIDGFVSLLSISVESVRRSTYFGGTGGDVPVGIALGSLALGGPVYIAGTTDSTNLPFAGGGARPRHAGGVRDGFVALFNATLAPPAFATYLGGDGHDAVRAVAVSPLSREVYVTGDTQSPDFPGARTGAQTALAGQSDAFVSLLSPSLNTLRRSTYLGGDGQEFGMGVAVDPGSGDVYAAGITRSTDFPGSVEGAQDTNHGGQDGFVAHFDPGIGGSKLRLVDPNGGEKVPAGSHFDIRWVGLAGMESFTLQYKWEGMDAWRTIVSRTTGESYSWSVPTPGRNRVRCAVKVIAHNARGAVAATDLSDAYFTIEVVTLTAPNGGENLTPGDAVAIGWATRGTVRPVARVRLLYSPSGADPWSDIALLDGNPGGFAWTVPPTRKDSTACKVRVDLLDAAGELVGTDASDGPFTMHGSARIDSPNGGEVLTPGEATTIAWTTHATAVEIARVRLSYSLNGRAPWRVIDVVDGNPGSRSWTIPGVLSDTRTVRVQVELLDALARLVASDVSDGNFMIWGSVQLVSPVGGEVFTSGESRPIEWHTSATSAPVATSWLFLTTDGGGTWEPLMHMAGDYGSWTWRVPAVRERKDRCLVRVRLKNDGGAVVAEDTSTAFFRIEPSP